MFFSYFSARFLSSAGTFLLLTTLPPCWVAAVFLRLATMAVEEEEEEEASDCKGETEAAKDEKKEGERSRNEGRYAMGSMEAMRNASDNGYPRGGLESLAGAVDRWGGGYQGPKRGASFERRETAKARKVMAATGWHSLHCATIPLFVRRQPPHPHRARMKILHRFSSLPAHEGS